VSGTWKTKGSGYRSASCDAVQIKCWVFQFITSPAPSCRRVYVCYSNGFQFSAQLGTFFFGSNGCTFHGTSFSFLFSSFQTFLITFTV